MILTQLRHAPRIYGVHPRIQAACEFLMREDLQQLHDLQGKEEVVREIDGRNLVVMFQEYLTRPAETAPWETHDYHIDLQFLLAGEEKVGYARRDGSVPLHPYDGKYDRTFLQPPHGDYVTVKEDLLILLFPEDAHQPRVLSGAAMTVKKVCFKILL